MRQYKAYGERFAVEANNNEATNGFYVSVCSVRDGDDFTGLGGKSNDPIYDSYACAIGSKSGCGGSCSQQQESTLPPRAVGEAGVYD